MFVLIEERTREDGYKVQRWESIGYELTRRQYPSGMVDIQVTPDKETSRFLPHIYVHTDNEGRPIYATIQTVSYGSLPIEEYKVLQRAMTLAICAAEEIEAQFIHPDEEGKA